MVVILRRLTLKKYELFIKLSIDLNDISVFVGRNNTGKSTALETIELLPSSFDKSILSMIPRLKKKGKYLNLRSDKSIAIVMRIVIRLGREVTVDEIESAIEKTLDEATRDINVQSRH